ncbi:hypothetical protein IFVP408_C290469 [Vibrio parahaemolyticus]
MVIRYVIAYDLCIYYHDSAFVNYYFQIILPPLGGKIISTP